MSIKWLLPVAYGYGVAVFPGLFVTAFLIIGHGEALFTEPNPAILWFELAYSIINFLAALTFAIRVIKLYTDEFKSIPLIWIGDVYFVEFGVGSFPSSV